MLWNILNLIIITCRPNITKFWLVLMIDLRACRPNITKIWLILRIDFRSNKVNSPNNWIYEIVIVICLHYYLIKMFILIFKWNHYFCKIKVYKFDIISKRIFKHKILWLYVSMTYTLFVYVTDCFHHLMDYLTWLLFIKVIL